jgi:choline/glycine/proline betaine transport protein
MLGRAANGPIGRGFDVVAVVATAFGITTTLALGAGQITSGLEETFGVTGSDLLELGLIAAIIAVSTTSVALGLQKGIRRLSEVNILLVALLLLFFLVFGPANQLVATTIEAAGAYLQTLPRQSLFTGATRSEDWLEQWTIFFWGWWIAWAPFVGMFIARISRGRTIGEFLFGVFIVPTVFTVIWFGTVGGAALELQTSGSVDILSAMGDVDARALFITIREIGAPESLVPVVSGLTILLIAIFFATSADSGTLVITTILGGGDERPPMWNRVGWSLGIGVLTAALTFAGDIRIIQSAVVLAALPFSVMLILMCAGLIRALTQEAEGPRQGGKAHRPRQPWTGEDEPDR